MKPIFEIAIDEPNKTMITDALKIGDYRASKKKY